MSLEVGQILGGQYLIERVIGRGSMGLVYKGRDTNTGQTVAIRLILPEFDNEKTPAFFESEAKAVGQLNSENIARLYNMGFLPSGEHCLIGEYVEGEPLQRRIRRVGHMSELAVAQLLIQLLECLSAAHEVSVAHRDLTPLSIFVIPQSGTGDAIKVIDFGISRLQLLTANPESPPAAIVSEIQSFQYLSPEQLNGLREIDPRSNIYTLGVIAYEAITGRLPFEGKDFGDLTFNILQGDPPSVEELAPESSSPFSQLISKAMARSPNARFQYAEEMYAAISNWSIRMGVSKSKLESGITDWRSSEVDVPVSSERPSSVSSPMAASDPRASRDSSSNGNEPPSPSQAGQLPMRDYFPKQSSLGLAEEDALFAPPPTAPRDEFADVRLDDLSAGTGVSEAESRVESASAPTALPQVELGPAPSVAWSEPVAEPAAVDSSPEIPIQTEQIPVEIDLAVPESESQPRANEESAVEAEPNSALRRASTILGIGGVGVRPAQSPESTTGVVVRAPQSSEGNVQLQSPSSEVVPQSFRPRQATEPGIYPIPSVPEPAPITDSVASTSVAPISQPSGTPPDAQVTAPAVVPVVAAAPAVAAPSAPVAPPATAPAAVADGVRASASVAQKVQPLAPSAAQPRPIANARAAAASPIDDDVPFARKRSRKPIVIAVVLLAAAGVVAALFVQQGPERKAEATAASTAAKERVATVPSSQEAASPLASVAVTASVEPAASAQAKPPSMAAAVASSSRKAAESTQTKTPKVAHPVQSSQLPGGAVSPKQAPNKGYVAKDPYNYR